MGWMLLKNRRFEGPYSKEQLPQLIATQQIKPEDLLIAEDDLEKGRLQYRAASSLVPVHRRSEDVSLRAQPSIVAAEVEKKTEKILGASSSSPSSSSLLADADIQMADMVLSSKPAPPSAQILALREAKSLSAVSQKTPLTVVPESQSQKSTSMASLQHYWKPIAAGLVVVAAVIGFNEMRSSESSSAKKSVAHAATKPASKKPGFSNAPERRPAGQIKIPSIENAQSRISVPSATYNMDPSHGTPPHSARSVPPLVSPQHMAPQRSDEPAPPPPPENNESANNSGPNSGVDDRSPAGGLIENMSSNQNPNFDPSVSGSPVDPNTGLPAQPRAESPPTE